MIINVARKELKSMFASPMGWVILALLMFSFGTYFLNAITRYFEIMTSSQAFGRIGVTMFVSKSVYGLASIMMLFTIPLLSMRLISEERRNQTLPFLFSAPISLTEIVMGKFLGLVAYLSIIVAMITLMLFTLSLWTDVDAHLILSNTFGLWLLVASFSALGLYTSSISQQPVVAALISFTALLAILSIDQFFKTDDLSIPTQIFVYLSLIKHFEPFATGVLASQHVIFFLTFTTVFLILTIRRLDAERLSQ